MKYDISSLDKDKIIDHYKIIKNKNNRYNIIIYYRKGIGKAFNFPYDDMIKLKKELDKIMLEQLKILVENDELAIETLINKANRELSIFAMVGKTISLLIPITFSIVFANPINLIFIPILMKITSIYKERYVLDYINDEYEVYEKYKMCVELENEYSAIKSNKIDLNKIDNYKIKELENLKEEIIALKQQDLKSLQLKDLEKQKMKTKKR